MSTTSGLSTTNLSGGSPQRALIEFLTRESPRYVPFPHFHSVDAIFVNGWFEQREIFAQARSPQNEYSERLFELMQPSYILATVIGIKHLVVNRHTENQGRFRLRWSKHDEDSSEIFLVTCHGLPDHVAVIPTSYIRRRYGNSRSIEGVFEVDQACPTLLAPFMVHHRHLVNFLEQVYFHASTSATFDLVNPTYSARYYGWLPELQRLIDVLPLNSLREKLDSMQSFYFASKILRHTMRLSYKDEPGHFTLNGQTVEYWKKAWCRRGRFTMRVSLKHQIPARSAWKFLLLEDYHAKEAICLPRNFVPAHLIGRTGHGRNDPKAPQLEVAAGSWAPFTFAMLTPAHTATAVTSIMRAYVHETECGLGRILGERNSRYESLTPRRTRSGTEDWILELLHR